MKERPILFSGAMVRALLAGTKTQTRRIVKPQPPGWARYPLNVDVGWEWTDRDVDDDDLLHWPAYAESLRCPYGVPGDRLWVRETWNRTNPGGTDGRYFYRADEAHEFRDAIWKPSIFMPRAASRIKLEVTGVRIERLHDISEADAIAEGLTPQRGGGWGLDQGEHFHAADPRISYWSLWDATNGAGSAKANPWVWVLSFQMIEP